MSDMYAAEACFAPPFFAVTIIRRTAVFDADVGGIIPDSYIFFFRKGHAETEIVRFLRYMGSKCKHNEPKFCHASGGVLLYLNQG